MPIEMPKGLPFSVDTFSPVSKKKRHHFLTHAHKDHTVGISTHFQYPIYSTRLTKSIILQHYSQLDESLFVGIEVGQTIVIDDPDGEFGVTAFDANHCPGSIMFLFEGHFGMILHTGDCRLTPECLLNLPEKYIGKKGKAPRCRLDYIFLDCTFGKFSQKLPSKRSAIHQVISCIWKHPDTPVVYLTCDLLGQEEILAAVSKTFGSKVFVDKASNPECFQSLKLVGPEILSEDPSSRFRMFDGFPKLYERASAKLLEARANFQPEPVIIRPSAQWYACGEDDDETPSQRKLRFNEAVKDQFGVWHVCYSIHSSREELEWALELLAPKRVVSTTPICRAIELDYVQKHCFSRITSDDPLWKLLDICVETSVKLDVLDKGVDCATLLHKEPTQSFEEFKLQPVERSSVLKELFSSSPTGKRPPVTLFGRARHGIADSRFSYEQMKNEYLKNDPSEIMVNKAEREYSFQEVDAAVNCKNNCETNGTISVSVVQCGKLLEKEVNESAFQSHVGSSGEEKTKGSTKHNSQQIVVNGTAQQFSLLEMGAEVKLHQKEFKSSFYSPVSSSKSFNETLRKLYRSKNVPVPRPLPSLVELTNTHKRTKRRFEFHS